MLAILTRMWIAALLALAIVFALEGFGLLTVAPVIVAILWALLALSLVISLILRQPTPQ